MFGSRASAGARPDSDLDLLVTALAGIELSPELLALQPLAVKARYSAEDTPLPGDRLFLWGEILGWCKSRQKNQTGL